MFPLGVGVALAELRFYTPLNNNICLKGCEAQNSADFASLCGRKRQENSARTPEALRRNSAGTPQELRNYSMNPFHARSGLEAFYIISARAKVFGTCFLDETFIRVLRHFRDVCPT